MKLRIPLIFVLALTAWIVASPSHARGLQIDVSTCDTTVSPTGTLAIQLHGTGKKGNSANAGVNFPWLNCSPSANFSALPYHPAVSLLYTSVDLAVAGVADYALQDVLNTTSTGLSSLADVILNPDTGLNASAAVVAQIVVLKLKQGGYEVQFNYQNGTLPTTACGDAFKPILPSLTWFETTYVFSVGADGVTTPCDSTATNDFVFNEDGTLLGYIDSTGTLISTERPPLGWIIKQ